MDRHNHYESAFEAYLQQNRICYVAVHEGRRAYVGDSKVKNLDFIVHTSQGIGLLVDVKGRRFPGGSDNRPRRSWQNWSGQDDIDGMQRWEAVFGQGYHGLLVFNFVLRSDISPPEDWGDLWTWQGNRYLLRAVTIEEYCRHLRIRSPRWSTVHISTQAFREAGKPFSYFTRQFYPATEEIPF